MTDESFDPEIADLAARLDAERPRPSRALRRRVHVALTTALRQRAYRRQSVWLIVSGAGVLVVAAVLAVTYPT